MEIKYAAPSKPPTGKYITIDDLAQWILTGVAPVERTWKQRQKDGAR